MTFHIMENGYSFLTKSAKIKPQHKSRDTLAGYSFLTKSAKIKQTYRFKSSTQRYSFLTKSAKIKHPAPKSPPYQLWRAVWRV